MRSSLKEATVEIEGIGSLKVRELSWKRMQEVLEAEKNDGPSQALTCKYGVPEWASEEVDDIADNLSPITLMKVCSEIYKLMGFDSGKDYASALNDDSPSD